MAQKDIISIRKTHHYAEHFEDFIKCSHCLCCNCDIMTSRCAMCYPVRVDKNIKEKGARLKRMTFRI